MKRKEQHEHSAKLLLLCSTENIKAYVSLAGKSPKMTLTGFSHKGLKLCENNFIFRVELYPQSPYNLSLKWKVDKTQFWWQSNRLQRCAILQTHWRNHAEVLLPTTVHSSRSYITTHTRDRESHWIHTDPYSLRHTSTVIHTNTLTVQLQKHIWRASFSWAQCFAAEQDISFMNKLVTSAWHNIFEICHPGPLNQS